MTQLLNDVCAINKVEAGKPEFSCYLICSVLFFSGRDTNQQSGQYVISFSKIRQCTDTFSGWMKTTNTHLTNLLSNASQIIHSGRGLSIFEVDCRNEEAISKLQRYQNSSREGNNDEPFHRGEKCWQYSWYRDSVISIVKKRLVELLLR